MTAPRFAIATLIGGIVLFATGYLIFEVMFSDFYAENAGSATGVVRQPPLQWAVAMSQLAYAALLTLVVSGRSTRLTWINGAILGAVTGFLIWSTADFVVYGTTNIANLTRTVADTVLEAVHGGLGGAAIALTLGFGSPAGGKQYQRT